MTATKTFVMRHPVVTYFVLTFLISWGGILVVLGPGAFTGATAPTEGSFRWCSWRCSPAPASQAS